MRIFRLIRLDEALEGRQRANISILARGPFVRRFELAYHVNVSGAKLANGLLTVDLTKEIPEEEAAPDRDRRWAGRGEQIEGNVAA